MDAQAYRNGRRAGTHGRGNGKDRANNEREALEAELDAEEGVTLKFPGFPPIWCPGPTIVAKEADDDE